MKKITILSILLFILSFSEISAASVILPVDGKDDGVNQTYQVSLDGLETNKVYQIICRIENKDSANTPVLFEPRLLPSTNYKSVRLNNEPTPSNSGTLSTGENQLSFYIVTNQQDSEHYNLFRIISTARSYQVEQCIANQETPASLAQSGKLVGSGAFTAFNETDHVVTVAIGNFWPTEYVIQPHDWRLVIVSSDNQNISVKKIQ